MRAYQQPVRDQCVGHARAVNGELGEDRQRSFDAGSLRPVKYTRFKPAPISSRSAFT